MGKWRAVLPIFGALFVALITSLLIYRYMETQAGPKEVTRIESEGVPVAVAAVDLTWGTKIVPEMLRMVSFTKESLPPGHYNDVAALANRVLVVPLKKNEPILESKLAPIDITTGGVSAVLAPGKRALAVKGDKVIGISGFIKPGDRVDVLVTLEDPRTNTDVTKLVLEKIPVLATGTEIQENKEGKPAPVDVYTLEVTPDEGEKLSLAATRGKLQFALRNIMDNSKILTKGATISQTLASLRPEENKPVRSVRRPRTEVEVIKGNSVTKVKF